jgi:hypothetical protein
VYKSAEQSSPKRPVLNPIRITGAIDMGLNMDKGWNAISTVFGLSADRIVAVVKDQRDWAQYGLDNPYSTVTVSGTLGQGLGGFSLSVSKPDAAENVYIRREGVDLVYEAAVSKFPWLELGWFELMNRMIIIPFIDSIAKVELSTPERTVAFALTGEEDELKVQASTNGQAGPEIDTSYFRTYYQTLLMAVYDEYTTERLFTGAKPFLEIRYHYRDNAPVDTVSFYTTGSRRVLTSFNGGRPFYTFSAYTDKVLADLDQILAGRKVMPYI